MPTKTIPLAEATADDLRYFAGTIHGLDVRSNASRPTVLAKLDEAGIDYSGGIIVDAVEKAPLDPTQFGKQAIMPAEAKSASRWRVMIQHQDGGEDPVMLGFQGHFISVKRGVEVAIPATHLESLENAKVLVYPKDANGVIIGEPKEQPRFAYSIFGKVEEEAA